MGRRHIAPLLHVETPILPGWKTPTKSFSPCAAHECGESDDEPFGHVERLKEDFLHLFVRGTERLEDLDAGGLSVHNLHFSPDQDLKQAWCWSVKEVEGLKREKLKDSFARVLLPLQLSQSSPGTRNQTPTKSRSK